MVTGKLFIIKPENWSGNIMGREPTRASRSLKTIACTLRANVSTWKPLNRSGKEQGAGLSTPVIGGEGVVYVPNIADPYFYSISSEGNGDGITKVNWIYQLVNKVEESAPVLYKSRAYVVSSGRLYPCDPVNVDKYDMSLECGFLFD